MSAIVPGSLVGHYRIVRQLGEGGMGAVYEAVHQSIERRVALKILHPENAARADAVTRFFNEARAVNLIDHPGVVQIADYGHTEDGTAYIVMELLRGESLAARLSQKGALAVGEALLIAARLASTLVACHAKGIVHRDLKPDNVMLRAEPGTGDQERVKLLDFGIAKLAESQTGRHPRTQTDVVMGTPTYMSPEQCLGAGKVDAQTDVYSLGVMLYEMLAGLPPFVGEGGGLLMSMHMFKAPPPLGERAPHVPVYLAELVHRLLAKAKDERPTMREVAATLQQLLDGQLPARELASRMPRYQSFLRALRGALSDRSTLGFSTGEAHPLASSRRRLRPAFRRAFFAAATLAIAALLFVGLKPRSAARPVPPPPPRLAATATRMVAWQISSEPPGAAIFDKDQGTLLGSTPLRAERPARPGRATVLLRLDGYETAEVVLDTEASGQVEKHLTRTRGPVETAARSRPLRPPIVTSSPGPKRLAAKPSTEVQSVVRTRPSLKDVLEK